MSADPGPDRSVLAGDAAPDAASTRDGSDPPDATDPTDAADPPAESWSRLDPLTIHADGLTATAIALLCGIPSGIVVIAVESPMMALVWVVPPMLLVAGAGFLIGWARYRVTGYLVDATRMRTRSGIVFKQRRSLHRDRIRSVDVTAGPVLRVLGLARVQIGTGEQSGAEGSINLSPVRATEADALRRTLLPPASAGDGAPLTGTLATFDPRWIRYVPLTWTPVVIFGVVYAVAGQILGSAGQAQESIIDWFLALAADVGWLVIVAVALAGPALVGVVGAVVIFVELWWGYRLEREGGTLRVRRGLLTTRSTSIQEARLRGVAVVEPLGARLAGAAQVDAVATGLRRNEDGNKNATENKTLLPLAPRAIADGVAGAVLRTPVAPTAVGGLTPHPRAARAKRLRWALAIVAAGTALLAAPAVWVAPGFWWVAAAWVVVGGPTAVGLAVDAGRNLGHRLDAEYLVTRSGTLRRTTVALQREGIVGWTVRQTWFQRRAGLATITATTAAGSGGYAMRDVDAGEGLAVAVAAVPGLLDPFLEPSAAASPTGS